MERHDSSTIVYVQVLADHRSAKTIQRCLGVSIELCHEPASDNDPPVCEALLFAYLIVRPARRVELRQNVPAASVRFCETNHEFEGEDVDNTAETKAERSDSR